MYVNYYLLFRSVNQSNTNIDMMHNFYTKYGKILEICKQYSKNLVNELGNTTKRGAVPKFSDLEVIALSLTAEAMSIDGENCLFARLLLYKIVAQFMLNRNYTKQIDRFMTRIIAK